MSTISSPRVPRSPHSTPNTSRRTSLDIHSRSSATSPARQAPTQRRNRAALRDYYGLKAAAPAFIEQEDAEVRQSELDVEGFNAENYVSSVLEREGLEGVLRAEARLVNEIRSLDGERKALVYNNYSKLIAATETIRMMRSNMDPLGPSTLTLLPAISHIAETSSSLAGPIEKTSTEKDLARSSKQDELRAKMVKERQAAKWVVETPHRFKDLLNAGERDEVAQEWADIQTLLDKWERRGVKGVDIVRSEVVSILKDHSKP